MVGFPNAKINLGLNVVSKRDDGFHNLETIFYPVPWCDILEIIPSTDDAAFSATGLLISGNPNTNLCLRAYALLKRRYNISGVKIHLHKIIPMGAGLGGGSSDAAFVLKMVNDLFELKLNTATLAEIALSLGSDCPFFVYNTPVFASGRGEEIVHSDLNLNGYHLVILKPNIHVATSEAFKEIKPSRPEKSLKDLIRNPVSQWKDLIFNDFENVIFKSFPEIKQLKEKLYQSGAVYASMSGSGSAVYGIFSTVPDIQNLPGDIIKFEGQFQTVLSA